MSTDLAQLARIIVNLERRLERVEAQSRLKSASLDDTALVVRDGAGSLRGIVGQQGDGTTAVTIVNGPPPPQPSAPIVLSVLGGVTASWDGLFTDGVLPLDWSRTEVHASPDSGFTPTAVTLQSTIETAQGATVVVPTDDPVYVRLVARSTSGTASAPSVQAGPYGPTPVVAGELLDGIVTTVKLAEDAVTAAKLAANAVDSTALQNGAVLEEALNDAAVSTAKLATDAVTAPKLAANAVVAGKIAANAVTAATIAAGAINTEKLTVAGGTNTFPDPSFEGAYTATLVAGNSFWSQAPFGNGSPTGLRLNCVAGAPTSRNLRLTIIPVLTGDQLYLAADYYASADWVGNDFRFFIRWYSGSEGSGTHLSTNSITRTPTALGAWERLSGTVTAPAQAVSAMLFMEGNQGSAGTVTWDNAVCRPIVPGVQIADGAITTPKIVAGAVQTLQLDAGAVNASKIAAGAVTTAALDALAVTADKIATNTITAGKLAAGSVDAAALKADAITGKTITGGTITGTTITGSTVQTATSGKRLVMTPDGHLLMYSGRAGGETPGELVTGINSDGEMELGYVVIKPPTHGPTPPDFTMAIGPSGEKQWFAGPLTLIDISGTSTAYVEGGVSITGNAAVGQNITATNISISGRITRDSGWSTLTPASGWTGYGGNYGPGRFRLMADGSIVLRDLMRRTATTTIANGNTIATLPAAYRPTTWWQQNAWVGGTTGGSLAVNINPDGTITLTNLTSGAITYLSTGSGYISLNSYSYFLD